MGHSPASVNELRKAIETRDAASLKSLYSDDAVITVIDSINTPSKPRVLHGLVEIGEYLDDVCSRDMSHAVSSGVVDSKHLAFVEQCKYPDGTRVVASCTADLGPGGIVRQTVVQAWDS